VTAASDDDDRDATDTAVTGPGLEPLAQQLLTNPLTNRGTAFTGADRDRLGLRGLFISLLRDQHIVMLGAGSAGIGVLD